MTGTSTCLLFETQAEEAARFYVGVFQACGRPAALGAITRYPEGMQRPAGSVLTAHFTLDGQEFMALNGPQVAFTPAVSLFVSCADQAELDAFWARLTEGGQPSVCGWLTDRFGLSWQVAPAAVMAMLQDPDPARAGRVLQAVMGMTKLDLAALRKAYG